MTFSIDAGLEDRGLELQLALREGETVALMGENGAGKSSVLGLIAGLLRADRGEAVLDGRPLFGPGQWLPPHQRSVALLSQEALLFPQLSVLENVAFGPRSQGKSRSAARAQARHWLTEAEAADLADRRPASLSGGQAQRVAIARALAADPALLLLDEPLAALDVAVAPVIRRMLRRVLAGRRAVIVTHDLLDALLLADRVVVLDNGRVAEEGTPQQLLARPRSSFTAGLAGLNLISGHAVEGGLRAGERSGLPAGTVVAGTRAGQLLDGEPAVAAFRPAAVSVFTSHPHGSPRNVLEVIVDELEPASGHVLVRAGQLAAEVTPAAAAELGLHPGGAAFFAVKASEVSVYPARTAG
ncbi:ABC transporter-like protein [Arthrobacter crystallopoietes BAB-32]|uniref:ABC transporter-like protein n=1 Tax=Arthrobacter crystallopoietes BAB-32 TaxID=1246476 RepID=N1V571_9MICC|nr:ATP-binding cassette domain-containing protein [Arthrobacter crystallopoietes]EMY35164.1 ABC transporter-like protein [Arthrobacter crystallopoietes BAB-32]